MSFRTYCLSLSLAFAGGGAVFIFGGLTFQGPFNVFIGVCWITIGLSFARTWYAIERTRRRR